MGAPWASRRRPRRHWRALALLLVLVVLFVAGMVAVGAWAVGAMLGVVQAPAIVLGSGIVSLLLLAAVALAAIRTFRGARRPIDELATAAERVEAGDFSTRVTVSGPGPVRRLATTFNTMSERLDATDQRRRSFLADVSHELRTPLTVLRGQLEAISDGVYTADGPRVAGLIEQTQIMERLIDDLRTISLAEAGALPLALQPTDVGALLDEVIASVRVLAAPRGVTLDARTEPGVPLVDVDPARIRQVISNLLDNAIRHSPDGSPVSASLRRDGRTLRLDVRDHGPGIPPELLPRVFERFARGPESSGTGLGLAIAKDLVEAHGGSISASSEGGRGTLVVVTLPLERGS